MQTHQTQTSELLNRLQTHTWEQFVQVTKGLEPPVVDLKAKVPDDQWLDRHSEDEPSTDQLVSFLQGVIDV